MHRQTLANQPASSAFNRGLIALALAAAMLVCPPAFADTHWSGTLWLNGDGNVYRDEGNIFIEFTIDDAGKVGGKGTATITPRTRVFVESDNCEYMHTVSPNTFDVAVEGGREPDEIVLRIRPLTTATLQVFVTGGPGPWCKARSGPPVPGLDPFAGLQAQMVKFHVREQHAATKGGSEMIPGGFKIDWELSVWCRDCCRSMRDGESGFIYVSASTATLHKDPSANSPITATEPHGARLLFRDTRQKDGTRWYYFNSYGRAGWVPLGEVSCGRPGPLPPGKKLYLKDIGLGNVHPRASLGGANG